MLHRIARRLAIVVGVLLVDPALAQDLALREDTARAGAQRTPLEAKAHLRIEGVRLSEALSALHESSGVRIAFSPSLLPAARVSCACEHATVGEALSKLLAGTSFHPFVIGNQILVEPASPRSNPSPRSSGTALVFAASRQDGAALAPRSEPRTTAEQQGSIAGQVVNAATQAPIAAAQVLVVGTGIGALTNSQGRFRLDQVSDGSAVVQVSRIGFSTETQTVQVTAGQVTTANFQLRETALELDEIVVTGTPGGTQRRALGNDVPKLKAAEVAEITAPPSMDAVLGGGRTPGVNVSLGSGNVGGGGQIRIRGLGSAALSNYPLIYVDGVRVTNAIGGPSQRDGNEEGFRLNDLNPDEIESIEIVKGPSAATLYGTEASAGVIQIITKRGVEGQTSFSATVKQGANWFLDAEERLPTHYWLDRQTRDLLTWHPIRSEIEAGYPSPLSVGSIRGYQLSARGGTDRIRYYIDGSHDYNQGYIHYNDQTSNTLRTNLDALLTQSLHMGVSVGLISSDTEFGMHPSPYSLTAGFMYGHPGRTATRGWYAALPEEEDDIETTSDLNRVTWSIKFDHETTDWLTQRLIVGQDFSREHAEVLFERQPEGRSHRFGQRALGDLSVRNIITDYRSLDYSVSANLNYTPSLSGQSSFGFQYYSNTTEMETANGQEFPAPGISVLGAAARTFAGGSFVQNKTLGMYIQQQFGWKNRLFLTGALRGDDNSAFGIEYNAAIYPKVSASWVVNEEPFWDNIAIVNALRLRGAWGQAGRNPDAFAATTLYNAVTGPGDQITLQQGSPGNPALGPEIGEELEVGFDAGLWEDRVSMTFTFYDKTTRDALLLVPIPMSTGFLEYQWTNLGEINNRGTELSVDAGILQSPTLGWEVGLGFSTNRNEVVSLGGAAPVIETQNRIVEGYPLNGWWIPDVVRAWWEGDPLTDPNARPMAECRTADGGVMLCDEMEDPQLFFRPQTPTWFGGVNSTVTLWRDLSFFANVEFAGGHGRMENGVGNLHRLMRSSYAINGDPKNGIAPDPEVVWAARRPRHIERMLFVHGAGFARLREVSASYRLPGRLAERLRASSASVTFAARNLWFLWQETEQLYGINIVDPELSAPNNLMNSVNVGMWPASSVVATFRVSF